MSWLDFLFGKTVERPSPKIRINRDNGTLIGGILTITGLEGCYLAAIAPTNSMEPGIDDGMLVILDGSIPYTDMIVGDIIYFENSLGGIIHRIDAIKSDNLGWYCETKGDNNSRKDGIKVRPEYIKGVWRATLN